MEHFHLIRYLVAGTFRRDFIVTAGGRSHFDIPGGSVPYAAAGFGMWDTGLGMIGSVGEDFPQEWLSRFEQYGYDTRGITILPETFDLRSFIFYQNNRRYESLNPITQFAHLGLAIPKSLLGYIPERQRLPISHEIQQIPIRIKQIPSDYLDASAAHICPLALSQQGSLISHLQGHVNTISLDLSESTAKAPDWSELFKVLRNIHTLHVSQEYLKILYKGYSEDIWEMVEKLATNGMEFIVVKRGEEGQYIFDTYAQKKWSIPAYPARVVDTSGCGDAFCGGFMAGYRKTYDPVEAALYGNISASFSIEGTGAFYSANGLPGLSEARVDKLRDMVKRI